MSIEFQCKQCQSLLRVPAEHAGKQAKCPKCEFINMIPMATPAAPLGSPHAPIGSDSYTRAQNTLSAAKQETSNNPYQSSVATDGQQINQETMETHRGGLILVMGIVAIIGCNCFLIPGILAWVWGAGDLSKMKAGRMDRSGESLTMVGMILGIASTALTVLSVIGVTVFQFLAAAL